MTIANANGGGVGNSTSQGSKRRRRRNDIPRIDCGGSGEAVFGLRGKGKSANGAVHYTNRTESYGHQHVLRGKEENLPNCSEV